MVLDPWGTTHTFFAPRGGRFLGSNLNCVGRGLLDWSGAKAMRKGRSWFACMHCRDTRLEVRQTAARHLPGMGWITPDPNNRGGGGGHTTEIPQPLDPTSAQALGRRFDVVTDECMVQTL